MRKSFIPLVLILSLLSCTREIKDHREKKWEDNLSLTIYNHEISEPEKDRMSFYVVYIDKVESGRTTTGLESQEKYFSINLQPNKHLITLEKWVLDKSKGRYVKLNNIEQPKPGFIYIIIQENKQTAVTMKEANNGVAVYTSELVE